MRADGGDARRRRRRPRAAPARTDEDREAARAERAARRAERAARAARSGTTGAASATAPAEAGAAATYAGQATPAGGALGQPAEAAPEPPAPAAAPRRSHARNTAIFSSLTGLSRIAGLAREIVAAALYGTLPAASAFTLAFQVPNLVRALVADAALSSAFVPVFSELLEQKRRREAFHAASALAGLLLVALTALTLVFILIAPWLMPLFTDDAAIDALTVGLSRVLFPIVVLLGLNGLVVGILNAHDHFTIPALTPLVWNLVIIAGMVVLTPLFEGPDQLYAYAIGVVAGTVVQLAMSIPPLRAVGFPLRISFDFRDPRIMQVLRLMLPVSVGLGLINISVVLNSTIGFKVSDQAPRAIDAAFRIYMLPQGMFSVAIATVLFPALARMATRRDFAGLQALTGTGVRQIALLLIPSAAALVVLSEPIVRLVYQRGEFDAESTRLTSEALLWFSFSLPFSGINLLLTRTFFSLQRPWLPTTLALASLAVNAAVSLALYEPLGIAGIVLGTTASNAVMAILLARRLRRELGGLEVARTLRAMALMTAAAALLAGIAYGTWSVLDDLLGRSLVAQIVSVSLALTLGGLAYAGAVLAVRLPEAHQIRDLFARRLRRSAS
jgi:putative peptidoglycan lipid II flippase